MKNHMLIELKYIFKKTFSQFSKYYQARKKKYRIPPPPTDIQ